MEGKVEVVNRNSHTHVCHRDTSRAEKRQVRMMRDLGADRIKSNREKQEQQQRKYK